MKSLTFLLRVILQELGDWCHTSTDHDYKTAVARIEHEGVSFLTISLTNFGKDFEKSLDQGYVADDQFTGFARTGGLPRFLGGFLQLVFERGTCRLRDDYSIDAIQAIRQITLMFGKVALECSDERKKAAIDGYISCEQEVREFDKLWSESSKEDFDRMGTLLWATPLSNIDLRIYEGEVIPKHGPGSTSDRLYGNRKYEQTSWPERLDAVFPHWENAIPNARFINESTSATYLEPGQELPVEIILVPKTLKTPRIIAREPSAMQYMQQGILEIFTEEIDADDLASSFISNRSQIPNQELARLGSLNGELATLDLSEASDRVSNQHVRRLFRRFPHLFEAVDATRSRKADVPGYGVQRLAKFASMGSALCFPMEAIVFATVIFLGIEKALNRRLTLKDIKSFKGRVRVYGDDIIVPVEYVSCVVAELEAYGFKVNKAKSFWTGKFRESCGKDYYDGHDVSIIRVRELLPSQRKHVTGIVSTVSLRNQLYKAGFWRTVKALDAMLERIIPFPHVGEESPALGRHSFLGYETEKMCENLHKPLVKAMYVSARLPDSRLDDWPALMKWFLKRGDMPFADRDHLLRAGRPVAVDIKHRWLSAY